jgi:ribosomal protein S18 acetylase RimI-like enzyme
MIAQDSRTAVASVDKASHIDVQPVRPEHRVRWDELYMGYAAFYRVNQTPEMRERVWGWLQNPAHEVKGMVALAEGGHPIGLCHYRPFARPLMSSVGGFIDDLFVDPAQRGRRVVDAMVEAVAREGRDRGWTVLRWITADDNYRARAAYDRFAKRTQWVTYDYSLS